jgi:glutathione synthase/RimK-type ligase-like ATP-grasp enzyme
MIDIFILTEDRYIDPPILTPYIAQILEEEQILAEELKNYKLSSQRVSWSDPQVNWESAKAAIFRTTWDYFDRFSAFKEWLQGVNSKLHLLNSFKLIELNLNKKYLFNLEKQGLPIVPGIFLNQGDRRTLQEHLSGVTWKEFVLKPAVSGAGRHTYRFRDPKEVESVFYELIQEEDLIIQEFQEQILSFGEISLILIGRNYSHAVLKKAKEGEFRVQDDFGGSVHPFKAGEEEIRIAEQAISYLPEIPLYARVDMVKTNSNCWAISELEMIEPELWFRFYRPAAQKLAALIREKIGV